jgi:hypothetical protein
MMVAYIVQWRMLPRALQLWGRINEQSEQKHGNMYKTDH